MVIQLGPFALEQRIGHGGMGEVWAGKHVAQGIPVAVKVLHRAGSWREKFLAAFEREAAAVARLDHPGIVHVYDYGRVPASAGPAAGPLEPGSPYLVMELATGGALSDVDTDRVRWPEARRLVLALLDALAHAHARGVIHRDIKFGNVLLPGGRDHRPGPKLTDFGIAAISRGQAAADPFADQLVGSPPYMAPEQFRDEPLDQGPWTDLYALGCLTWRLVTGSTPFSGVGFPAQMAAHLEQDPPRLAAHFAVPGGLESWLRVLLAKEPAARFQCAADAARALTSLDHGGARDGALLTGPTDRSTLYVPTDPSAAPDPERTVVQSRRPKQTTAPGTPRRRGLATLPQSWRRVRGPASPALRGAGLGLFGLRAIPLVGRETQRDQLWGALGDVVQRRRPRSLFVRGPAGCGKSRLVEWIAERAEELGAARLIRVAHAPMGGAGHGVEAALARHLAVEGLSRGATIDRLVGRLRAQIARPADATLEARGLADLLHVGPDATESSRFGSPAERHRLVWRQLAREAAERPLILWLDDVQWSADALGLIEHVMDLDADDAPVFILATIRDEALAGSPPLVGRVDQLLRRARTSTIELGALPSADHALLVRELLGLEGDLARQVERRTDGNPLFAVQLVGDWVSRGLLLPGPGGFVLRPGAEIDLPDDIHSLWRRRLDLALVAEPDSSWTALELAAALGRHVDSAEWEQALELASVPHPDRLVEALERHRLATRTPRGWAWVHSMLRESVERSANTRGTWRRLHRACARMIQGRYGAAPRAARRLGRHLFCAWELDSSLDALVTACWEARALSQHDEAFELLGLHDEALRRLDRPEDDEAWGHSLVLRATLLNATGRDAAAIAIGERALEQADVHGWEEPLAEILRMAGWSSVQRGDLAKAAERFRRGAEQAAARNQIRLAAPCLAGQGFVSLFTGALDEAERLALAAEAAAESLGDLFWVSEATKLRAGIVRQAGRLEEAEGLYRDAHFGFTRIGNRSGLAQVHNELAEMARASGELQVAEQHYLEARQLFIDAGSDHVRICDVNRAQVLLAHGRFDEAEPLLEAAVSTSSAPVSRQVSWCATVGLLVCAAARGDWARWDALSPGAAPVGALKSLVERDVATLARQAGELAHAAGHIHRAWPLLELALSQFEELGQQEDAEAVRRALDPGNIRDG